MRIITFFTAFLLIFFSVSEFTFAQRAGGNLSTPRESLKTFMFHTCEGCFEGDEADKHLEGASEVLSNPGLTKLILSDIEKRTKMLYEILEATGTTINPKDYPNFKELPDSLKQNGSSLLKVVVIRETALNMENVDGKWYFAESTVEVIPQLHAEIFFIKTSSLLDKIGWDVSDSKKFLGLHIWQYLGLLVFISLSVFLYLLVVRILKRVIYKMLLGRLIKVSAVRKIILSKIKPFTIMVILILVQLSLPILELPGRFSHFIFLALRIVLPIYVVLVAYFGVDLITYYFERAADKTENKLDDQLVPLLSKSLKMVLMIIGLLYAMQNIGINITGLIAGLSIGGLAVALAAQETLKNFFGSIVILLDHPFQVDDWIKFNGVQGFVEEVGLRSTRIRTFDDSLITIPNGNLSDVAIENIGKRRVKRYIKLIEIRNDTPSELIEIYIKALREQVTAHPRVKFFHIAVFDMDLSVFKIFYNVYFEVNDDWESEIEMRQELILGVARLSEQTGVKLASQMQTLKVEQFPEKESMNPKYPNPENKEFSDSLTSFFERMSMDQTSVFTGDKTSIKHELYDSLGGEE